MGHDLDSLLDATGIGGMAGTKYEKTAAEGVDDEPYDFSKLAQQCRDAATEPVAHREARGRELVEKTAAVTVITKTIDEINAIVGDPVEKIASDPATVQFVNEALNRGHAPEKIAIFLKQAGLGRAIKGIFGSARAGLRQRSGSRLVSEGRKLEGLAKSEYGHKLRQVANSGNLNKQQNLVEKLRRKFGDKEAGKIISNSGANLKVPGVAELTAKTPAASATVGGKKLSISRTTAGKAAPVAAGAAGAYVLTRKKSDDRKGGVTVIRG